MLKYFSYFSQEIVLDFLCTASLGDKVHELSNPIFWKKKKKKKEKNVVSLLSAEFIHSTLCVNIHANSDLWRPMLAHAL